VKKVNYLFSSEMTFIEFIVGLFNRHAFPYDRHLEFQSALHGVEIGGLIADLVNRSPFELDPERTTSSSNFNMYVYKDSKEDCHNWDRVIEIKVFREGDRESEDSGADLSRSFSPSCRIEIECVGYPF